MYGTYLDLLQSLAVRSGRRRIDDDVVAVDLAVRCGRTRIDVWLLDELQI